jgi:hypothetical protein
VKFVSLPLRDVLKCKERMYSSQERREGLFIAHIEMQPLAHGGIKSATSDMSGAPLVLALDMSDAFLTFIILTTIN